jgi:NAD(P) transhydrogenase
MSLRLDRKKSLRQLVGRLQDVTDRQTRQIERNLKRHGIELIAGTARFVDASTLAVTGEDGAERRLSAHAFLIATGSSPLPPPGIQMRDPDLVDSDRILDLDRVPSALTVVGGGVIGTEYACLFAALGTRVTLVEGRNRILGGVDEELSSALQLSLERMGAEVILGDAVESVERTPGLATDALRLKLKSGRTLQADKVLFSAGRSGNTANLNLEAAGVAVADRGRIPVNEHFQTNVPNIYAAGDVIGSPSLAATAMEQGRVAMCHAFQIAFKMSVSAHQPYGIYSIPEISTIGPSEQDLKARGIAYEAGHARFDNNARGQITGDADGFVKILFDPGTRRLISAHILGEHATELIHIPMFVLSSGGTIDTFIDAVFNYPTLAESFKYAAYDGLQRLAQRQRSSSPEVAASGEPLPPAMRPWFAGLSLPGPPGAGQSLTLCLMDRWRRCRFVTWSYEPGGAGLLTEEVEREGFVLALGASDADARELLDALVRRGFSALAEDARQADVVLVSPEAFWKAWGVRSEAKPDRAPAAARQRYEVLRAQGLDLSLPAQAGQTEALDAAASAFAAYLWATGQAGCDGARVIAAPSQSQRKTRG